MPLTHFTICHMNTGLACQLMQMDRLYAIGRTLGLIYLHQPLYDGPADATPGYEADTFLGLGVGEKRLSAFLHPRCHDPNDPRILRFQPGQPIPPAPCTLLQWVQQRIATEYQPKQSVVAFDPNNTGLRIWPALWGGEDRLTAGTKEAPPFPYADKYWLRRAHWPAVDVFEANKVRVAVHIRLGTYFPLEFRSYLFFGGGKHLASRPMPLLRPEMKTVLQDCRSWLQRLAAECDPERFSVRIFSDGYDTAYCLTDALPWTPEEQSDLRADRAERERDLASLEDLCGAKPYVGDEHFYTTVHSLITADVVLCSPWTWFPRGLTPFSRNPRRRCFRIPGDEDAALTYCQKVTEP